MGKRDKIIWTLYINHRCNLECGYCYLKGVEDKRVISKTNLFKTIDFIHQYSRNHNKAIELGFFGKEPLLNVTIIKNAVDYIMKKNYKIDLSINTNGLLLNKKIFHYFVEHNFKIVLSIDKLISQKDSTHLCKALNKDNLVIRTTINAHNISYLSKILTDFANAGFSNVSISFDYSDIRFESLSSALISNYLIESFITYMQIKKSNYNFSVPLLDRIIGIRISNSNLKYNSSPFCKLGNRIYSIDLNGDIYPCWRFLGDNRFIIGNVLKGELIPRTYSIDIAQSHIKSILPFDYICFWAYSNNLYMLNNNLKILSAFQKVFSSIF